MRLWIDTDVGANVDDAVALLMAAAHPGVELAGVSTVGDDPERRAAVATALLAAAGVDLGAVPIVAGPDEAVTAVTAAGADALLAIGPLTTVAAMTVAGVRPKALTVMGGALAPVEHRGELRTIEHNFGSDPAAAAAVLAAGGATIVPLDVTVATRLDERGAAKLVAAAPVLEPMVETWVKRWGAVMLHDPSALLVAAGDGPMVARLERRRLAVEPDGRLVEVRGGGGADHDVVTKIFPTAVFTSVLALLGG